MRSLSRSLGIPYGEEDLQGEWMKQEHGVYG